MRDVPRLYLLTFLLASYTNSKSYASKDMDSGSSGIEIDLGKDDSVSVHESYRPRHKFKTGTGQFSKRFVGNKNEMQTGKGLECAVMYKNNEPIGILQPYEESYRFLPVNGEPTLVDLNPVPAKRKTIMDVLYPSEAEDDYYDDSVGFSDERYPSIFAKFKIDSRLDRSLSPKIDVSKRSMKKRELFNGQVSLNDQVEEELRNILGDIGLVDDYPNQDSKRKAEDENLELGTNKIEIAKESREKRFDFGNTLIPVERTSTDVSKPELEEIRSVIEPLSSLNENLNQEESVSKDSRIDKEESVVAEADPREKRGGKEVKKPNVAVANDDMPVLACNTEKVEENNNLDDYGKRVEREIRDKIHKLKEEVKKEIENLRKVDHDEMDNTERKKKQTLNTQAEEGNSNIEPNASGHGNDDVNIRRKRSVRYPDTAGNVEEIVSVDSEEIPTVDNQNLKTKAHQSRSLKQLSADYASEEEDEDDNEPTRKKRQVAMEDENDYSYDDSESGFIDENRIADSEEGDSGDMVESFASKDKTGCSCDKNSGDCKCANGQSKTGDLNSKEHAASPGKNPAHHHCSCSKNDNSCKCGSPLIDDVPLELSGYDDAVEFEIVPKPKAEKRSVLMSPFHKVHIARQSSMADDFDNYRNSWGSPFKSRAVKRETNGPFENGQYFIDLQPSIFKLSPAEKAPDPITDERMPTKRHLVAVRQQRRMSPHSRFRRRVQRDENNREPRQLIDMSEEDIFGALPQSYEGELARYKRVKRNRKK